MGQGCLEEADQIITVDGALMLQAFYHSYLDLGREAVKTRIDRGADDRRKFGINQGLPADHHKDPKLLWITAARLGDTIQVAPFHRST